jgi:ATP-binding cassette subfamily F protein 3
MAPLRKRVTKAETELAHLTRQLHKLDQTLADGGLFSRDPARAAELSKTRANVVDAIAKAEQEWLVANCMRPHIAPERRAQCDPLQPL